MPPRTRTHGTGFSSSADVPAYLTKLIGRDADVVEVSRLLRENRLVSLVGAGGSGKTRLAAAVGGESRRRFEGVAWIDLSPLADPAVLNAEVAAALGLREQPGRGAIDALIERIGGDAVLLVLDNCEHVLTATAALADTLLRGCPALHILTTSRQALGIAGEKAWLVPPLALPDDVAAAAASPAVQLFVQRASDAVPGFALSAANGEAVTHICRRLDGLPLAIELAAARVRLLPPAQLAARLDSMLSVLGTHSERRLPRHRTLRALIDWSFELLSPAERRLLVRLSVFAGGFSLDAAEHVTPDDALPATDVLELLAALVDKSLVTAREWHGEARFALLETVRQYAWQQLLDDGEADALRDRHAAWCVELAERAEPHVLGGMRIAHWMTRLEHEHANLRAAMDWCERASERAPLALRLGAALLWFHFTIGRFAEARHALELALHHDGTAPRVRGRALTALGYMALWTGDAPAVRAPLLAGVELLRTVDCPHDLAFALTGLGTAAGLGGDAGAAYALFDEAERALGDPALIPRDDFPRALLSAFARYWRGSVAVAHGDLPLARSCYAAAIAIGRRWDSHPTMAHPLTALARVQALLGELDQADAALAESLPIHAAQDDCWGLIQALEAACLLHLQRGAALPAARALGAADRLRREAAVAPTPPEQEQRAQLRAALSAQLDARELESAAAQGADLPIARLIQSLTAGPAVPSASAVGMPADLAVRALGALEVFIQGEPLAGDAFGSNRPRELLLLLLCHPDGRTREQVGLEFWPDASTAQVKNAFHVTLHRLRRALGHPEWIVLAGDRYRIDPALRVDFDVNAFRGVVEPALRSTDADPDALRAALELYRGDFLDGELVGDWHLTLREQLRHLYREGLRLLGRRHLDAKRIDAAADAFRALLAADPLDEAACRALMTCHALAGSRVEAIRLYENVSRLLDEQLGTAPTRETTELYRQLQAAAPPL